MPQRRSWLRRGLRGFGRVLLVLALLVAVLLFVASRPAALRWAVERASALSGDRLHVEGLRGALFEPLSIERLRWGDPADPAALSLDVHGVHFDYAVEQVFDGRLHVERLGAERLVVTLPAAPASPPAATGPFRLPRRWPLPVPVDVADFSIGSIVVQRHGAAGIDTLARIEPIHASLETQGGRVRLSNLHTVLHTGDTALRVDGHAVTGLADPFDTDLSLRLQMPMQPEPLIVDVTGKGPLREFALTATSDWAGAHADVQSTLYVEQARPVRALKLMLTNLDLKHVDAALPVTAIQLDVDAQVQPPPPGGGRPARPLLLTGPVVLRNGAAGPIDQDRIPVSSLRALLDVDEAAVALRALTIDGPAGALSGRLGYVMQPAPALRAELDAPALALHRITSALAERTIALHARIDSAPSQQGLGLAMTLDAHDDGARLGLVATLADQWLKISKGEVDAKPAGSAGEPGRLRFDGDVQVAAPNAMHLRGTLHRFDPSAFVPMAPASVSGRWAVDGALGTDTGAIDVKLDDLDGRYDGRALSGRAHARVELAARAVVRVAGVAAELAASGARVAAGGALGRPSDRLDWSLVADDASRLDPRLEGVIDAKGRLSGALTTPGLVAHAALKRLRFASPPDATDGPSGPLRVQLERGTIDVDVARLDPAHDVPLSLDASLTGLKLAGPADVQADTATVQGSGTMRRHALTLRADGPRQAARLEARGGFDEESVWSGRLSTLSLRHPLLAFPTAPAQDELRLLRPVDVVAGARRARIDDLRLSLAGAPLTLERLDWSDPRLTLKAGFAHVPLRWAERFVAPAGTAPAAAPATQAGGPGASSPALAAASASASASPAPSSASSPASASPAPSPRTTTPPAASAPRPAAWPTDLRFGGTLSFTGEPADVSGRNWTAELRIAREDGDIALRSAPGARPQGTAATAGTGSTGAAAPAATAAADASGSTAASTTAGSTAAGSPTATAPASSGARNRRPDRAGIRTMALVASVARGGRAQLRLQVDGTQTGSIDLSAGTTLQGSARQPFWSEPALQASALDGRLLAGVPSFRWLATWMPDAWRIEGSAKADVALGGTLADPRPRGTVTADGVRATDLVTGLRLRQGQLLARIDGRVVDVERMHLASDGGTVDMSGRMQAPEQGPSNAKVVFDRLALPIGQNRRIRLSGTLDAGFAGREAKVSGRLTADEGSIDIQDDSAPSLGSDVVVVGADGIARSAATGRPVTVPAPGELPGGASAAGSAGVQTRGGKPGAPPKQPAPEPPLRILADLDIDLGHRFRVYGMGLDARLEGLLHVGGELPDRIDARGVVHIVDGRYLIYGRRLEVSTGTVTFTGPIANPALNITAIRPFVDQQPGVQIVGTADNPKVLLVSKDELADTDRLSYLLFGVPLADAGGPAQFLVLQALADQMMGNPNSKYDEGFTEKFGIDSFGVSNGDSAGGPTDRGTVVSVGKRLNKHMFLTYEQSVRGTYNIVKLTYTITNGLSAVVQAGTESAVDLLYHWLFD